MSRSGDRVTWKRLGSSGTKQTVKRNNKLLGEMISFLPWILSVKFRTEEKKWQRTYLGSYYKKNYFFMYRPSSCMMTKLYASLKFSILKVLFLQSNPDVCLLIRKKSWFHFPLFAPVLSHRSSCWLSSAFDRIKLSGYMIDPYFSGKRVKQAPFSNLSSSWWQIFN